MHRCMTTSDFCCIFLYSRKRFARVPSCIFSSFFATAFGGSSLFLKSAASLLRIKNPEVTPILASRTHAKSLSRVTDSWGPHQFCTGTICCLSFCVFAGPGVPLALLTRDARRRKEAPRECTDDYTNYTLRTKTIFASHKDSYLSA